MISNTRTFLHLGIHKTGSTFMQERFFPVLNGISYCHCRTRCRRFIDYLLHADDFEFKADYARELFDADATVDRSLPIVLSDEMFYAPLTWNGYVHRRRGCDRLAEVFPEGHAAIVLRNQRDLLESLYREYIKNGGTSSWHLFLRKQVAPGYLHYDSYVSYLLERFGSGSMTVFFYEDLVLDMEEYLGKWCDTFGVPRDGWDREAATVRSNPAISPGLLAFLRVANRVVSNRRHPELVLPRSLHGLLRAGFLRCSTWFKGSNRRLCPDNETMRDLLDGCRDGNRRISGLVARDLSELGYPC